MAVQVHNSKLKRTVTVPSKRAAQVLARTGKSWSVKTGEAPAAKKEG